MQPYPRRAHRFFGITQLLLASLLGLLSFASQAQISIDVTGVGQNQLPIAVPSMAGEDISPQHLSNIINTDLHRSGRFAMINATGVVQSDTQTPDFSAWKAKNADYLVGGSVARAGSKYLVNFKLWDAVKGSEVIAQSFTVVQGDLRLTAHRIADIIYEALIGEKPIFATRIAYVTQAGKQYRLWIADSDGQGEQVALASNEPIISPAWSPDGSQLAYVSFESRKPIIYLHTLATGQRRVLANFKGSNSAPAWSPDGKSMVMTLSMDGGSQLFTIPVNGGAPRRLLQSNSIDTESAWGADGHVYFVSDRGGSPQIYRVNAAGGEAKRITFSGAYNVSPSISPDGKNMAYISSQGGAYKLMLMDLSSGNVRALTDTAADESPNFSPNGKLILYATKIQGREALMSTTLDGSIKSRLMGASGDIREPDWGPYR